MKAAIAYLITILAGPTVGALFGFMLFSLFYPVFRSHPVIWRFITATAVGIGSLAFGIFVFRMFGLTINIWIPVALAVAFLWNDSRRLSARRQSDDGSPRGGLTIKIAEADRFGDAVGVLIGYLMFAT